MSRHPIPDAALDDRLGFVGTAGSGKTYNSGGAVERVLERDGRVIIPDPLSVWWGLRLMSNGKTPSPYNVVIFGGPHGDLPINEQAGALIGETAARMAESCILDLSQLGTKASERRFMLAFLGALYRQASGEPVHVVFDEADMWAPQKLMDKDGDAARLLGQMETIVRRGRIKGFIPWLITQRPAVLSKDVLSQVDGLVAFKLTSSQDRKALGDWIEGQADREQGKAILASLPEMQRGQGIVWVPGRGILETVAFPEKKTFDSSRTPKRGERKRSTQLPPLNIDALKARLASVEAEVKANDPKALRAEIVRLTRELSNKTGSFTEDHIDAARHQSFELGYNEMCRKTTVAFGNIMTSLEKTILDMREFAEQLDSGSPAPPPLRRNGPQRSASPLPKRTSSLAASSDDALSGSDLQLLGSLAWWWTMGFDAPTRVQVASIAGWRVTSGHLRNVAGSLKTRGFINYPRDGTIALTEAGKAAAPMPDLSVDLHDRVRSILDGSQLQAFEALTKARHTELTREQLAERCNWSPGSGHLRNVLGSMRSMELIDYPSSGSVALAEWLTACGEKK